MGENWQEAGFWNYGYTWWLASQEMGDYLALGKDGQYIYVNPEYETVNVRLGWRQGGLANSRWLKLFQNLAASVRDEEKVQATPQAAVEAPASEGETSTRPVRPSPARQWR
jgi:CubicO group peptidase (beta-lactamase class C family)